MPWTMTEMMTSGCIRSASYHIHSCCHERWNVMVNHCESYMPHNLCNCRRSQWRWCSRSPSACPCQWRPCLCSRRGMRPKSSGCWRISVFFFVWLVYACTIFISLTFLWHPFACNILWRQDYQVMKPPEPAGPPPHQQQQMAVYYGHKKDLPVCFQCAFLRLNTSLLRVHPCVCCSAGGVDGRRLGGDWWKESPSVADPGVQGDGLHPNKGKDPWWKPGARQRSLAAILAQHTLQEAHALVKF